MSAAVEYSVKYGMVEARVSCNQRPFRRAYTELNGLRTEIADMIYSTPIEEADESQCSTHSCTRSSGISTVSTVTSDRDLESCCSISESSEQVQEATMMLRRLPKWMTIQEIAENLNDEGLKGTYDFIIMPRGKERNLGFAYVNFTSQQAADRFQVAFHNQEIKQKPGKTYSVQIAKNQGDKCLEKVQDSKDALGLPVFFDAAGNRLN